MQLLVSALNANIDELILKMRINSDAIIVNQCNESNYREVEHLGHTVRVFSFDERGVGLSRNNALMRAGSSIAMFSDDDIEYVDDYEKLVEDEFSKYPKADVLLFEFDICEARRTYHNTKYKRVRWYNCGRYPTFCMAFRTSKVHDRNITFSLLFGGGAKYSNGEDSLFLQECIKKGLKVYVTPTKLGREIEGESTWFKGYNEKFFYDRGVLYRHLYGNVALLFGFRFLIKHKDKIKGEISFKDAYRMMKKGSKVSG